MSGRGRGWGRGRGRGAGGLEIRDEDGSYVTKDLSAPPPLYPDLSAPDAPARLPRRVEATQEEKELKADWRTCHSNWQNSPLYLQLPQPLSTGLKRSLDDFMHSASNKTTIDTREIFKVVTLSDRVFPGDLISSQDRRISQQAAPDAFLTSVKKSKDSGLPDDFLKRLDDIKENPDGKEKKEEDKEEEEADEDEMDDLNESEIEDDDYMQGNEYDDDEGYDDDLEGGGDDEPVF